MARAFEAVDAYTDDRRVIGNSLMAGGARPYLGSGRAAGANGRQAARSGGAGQRCRRNCGRRRRSACPGLSSSRRPVRAALTILILRSIVLPLGRIGDAMAALTSGRTDVEIARPAMTSWPPWRARWRCSAKG